MISNMNGQLSLQQLFESYLNKVSIFVNKDAMSINYIPSIISHRDKEISLCAQILTPSLRLECPSNLFVYGKTGTGKTVSIKYVCKQLELVAQSKNIPVKFVYINCKMRKVADTEYRLIAQLSRELGHEVPVTGLPTEEVYKIFERAVDDNKKIILLVLDEVDNLIKKCGDEVLYNFTRMNSELKNSKICLVGISNDITMKNNFDPRVKSSLNEEEIIFPPYDAIQLKDILTTRNEIAFMKGAVSEEIISKCAAYAAREDGDARRALNLLRVAGELAERDNSPYIEEKYLDKAQEKIEIDLLLEQIKTQPKQSMAVLHSIMLEKNNTSNTGDVFNTYKDICLKAGIKFLTQRRFSDLISELDLLGVINTKIISKGRYGRTREIILNFSDDVKERVTEIVKENLGI